MSSRYSDILIHRADIAVTPVFSLYRRAESSMRRAWATFRRGPLSANDVLGMQNAGFFFLNAVSTTLPTSPAVPNRPTIPETPGSRTCFPFSAVKERLPGVSKAVSSTDFPAHATHCREETTDTIQQIQNAASLFQTSNNH
jgi:hypothetical protein